MRHNQDQEDELYHDVEGADRKERLTEAARREEIDDVRWLMSSKRGRRFMWRLLEQAGIYRTTYVNSATQTAFLEGGRNFGLMLVADIHAGGLEQYTQMVAEAHKENERQKGDA